MDVFLSQHKLTKTHTNKHWHTVNTLGAVPTEVFFSKKNKQTRLHVTKCLMASFLPKESRLHAALTKLPWGDEPLSGLKFKFVNGYAPDFRWLTAR
jgi:hypothetical protein